MVKWDFSGSNMKYYLLTVFSSRTEYTWVKILLHLHPKKYDWLALMIRFGCHRRCMIKSIPPCTFQNVDRVIFR